MLAVGDLDDGRGLATRCSRGGEDIHLTATEFELLRYFMRNPKRVLSKAQILDRVWQYDFGGQANIVELYVSYLRRKIDKGREPMLHTLRGVGYVLKPGTRHPRVTAGRRRVAPAPPRRTALPAAGRVVIGLLAVVAASDRAGRRRSRCAARSSASSTHGWLASSDRRPRGRRRTRPPPGAVRPADGDRHRRRRRSRAAFRRASGRPARATGP